MVEALVAETGLWREGVVFALDHVLELAPTEAELATFVARATPRSAVAVILAANVFTAPSRAVAWALAQSSNVTVRPSRRAFAFLEPRGLRDHLRFSTISDQPELEVEAMLESLPERAALHAYGSAATVASIVTLGQGIAQKRPDLRFELHGPGFGAIVAHAASIEAHADAIARDLAVFDQRGCLSPRVALVLGSHQDARAAAHALARALHDLDVHMPRGRLTDAEKSAITLAVEMARYAGSARVGDGYAVLELGAPRALTLGPVGRVLPILSVESLEHVRTLLAPHASSLTTIATDEREIGLPARLAALGRMQTPPFDGPVDLRALSSPTRGA